MSQGDSSVYCGLDVNYRNHARRSNQSTLKEISPEFSLQGLMLKLRLQYFDQPMQRADSLEKTLMLGKTEGRRRRGRQRTRCLDDITSSMDTSLSTLWEMVKDREAWRAAVHGAAKAERPKNTASPQQGQTLGRRCQRTTKQQSLASGSLTSIRQRLKHRETNPSGRTWSREMRNAAQPGLDSE